MTRGGTVRSGNGEAGSETELKLRVSPRHRREVLAALRALSGPRRGSTQRLAATYYDTPGLELRQQRIALRVRREGRRWMQTVKGGGSAASGVHRRIEIEAPLAGPVPDLSRLPRHPLTRILQRRGAADALAPVFETEIVRTLFCLEPAPEVVVEAAFDCGILRSGRRRESVCEIELELKRGPVAALFALAQQLVARLPFALEHRSKAERGYALHLGAIAPPLKAAPVLLNAGMTAGQAFQAVAASALIQVQANEHGTANADDPEYLHQMRVGLRRLRSLLRLFRELLGDEALPHAEALRAVAAALGPAREWDVLVTETLPPLAAALSVHAAMPAFLAACEIQRRQARKLSKKSIKTNTYNYSQLLFGAWLDAADWSARGAAWGAPAQHCAADILERWHARVLKRGRRIGRRSDEELHRLRIAVKQLRYAVEFFATLFRARGMALLRERLAELQDILGSINDAAAVAPLVGRAAAAAGGDAQVLAGIVIGHSEARGLQERALLQAAWRRFRATRRPWRE